MNSGRNIMTPLGLLVNGEYGEVVEIRRHRLDGACDLHGHRCRRGQSRVENLGLRVGKNVEMVRNEGYGPVVVKIDESRIAMARGLAMRILIRREES